VSDRGLHRSAVIYAAKSTEDKHGSIGTQLDDGRALADREGWEVVGEFTDEAFSGYHGNRGPGLAQALAECEANPPCALIVQHSDRLARGNVKDARHVIEFTLWSIKTGVRIVSKEDPETFPEGEHALLMGAVAGHRNHEDSRRKGQAVKKGLRRRVAERKQFFGGRRPYGYRWASELIEGRKVSHLEVEPAEAKIVRRIFSEYLAGKSQRSIAIGLNDDHVPTLTGTNWYATTVAGMLRNELYRGRLTIGGESFEGDHEPILDEETWQRAVERREAMASSPGKGRGRRTRGSHLFTDSLLRCTCGAPMSPVTKTTMTPGRLYEVYACARRLHHGVDACEQGPIKRTLIDKAVLEFFEKVAVDVEQNRAAIVALAERKRAEHDALRHQAVRQVAKAQEALERIEGDYIAGRITAEQWGRLEDRLRGELDAAQAEVEQHEQRDQTVSAAVDALEADAALLEALAKTRRRVAGEITEGGDLEQWRQAIRRLFVGFELCSPAKPFGSSALAGEGVIWTPQSDDAPTKLGHGYSLLPVVRAEALDRDATAFEEGFPALTRGPLPLSDNLCSLLAAW
jgi:site-specific DNA recombinase